MTKKLFCVKRRAKKKDVESRVVSVLFQIVTRGKIVETSYEPPNNNMFKPLTEDLLESISPSGRYIIFCCDTRTGEVIADSIKLTVEPTCKSEGVSGQTFNQSTVGVGGLCIRGFKAHQISN